MENTSPFFHMRLNILGDRIRKRILVRGIVQGVGFRPFVYRLAVNLNLKGFVSNSSSGVVIEVEGDVKNIERFINEFKSNPPPLAKITGVDVSDTDQKGELEFAIKSSSNDGIRSTLISPDISICDDCLSELNDPEDRRYGYPFINCTNCGPRYTIIKDIPYDRPKTTMSVFKMCTRCRSEYEDPSDRRFHAQPNACPVCGPHIWICDSSGKEIPAKSPISKIAEFIRKGKIAAVKGLGGFHLACDATSDESVRLLRYRKRREEKPLAVMALDIETVEKFALIGQKEKDLLLSPRRPIVVVEKRYPSPIAESVAPGNRYIGVMLPYTPLHYLLLKEGFTALVMTSGNISEEPIAIGNDEAVERLGDIADVFLMHNRDIYIRSDDSVMTVVGGIVRSIRRSRGYVPMPVFLREEYPPVLGVGGELKNTICFLKDDQAFLSQHIGDLENMETLNYLEECVDHLSRILEVKPEIIACDLHPDYLSTKWAKENFDLPIIGVQHHHAHIAACLAENGRDDLVIGLSLDGTGYGDDGNIWGGEILLADLKSYERIGHFEYHPMPGGEAAIREPWRMGVAYLYEFFKARQSGEIIGDFIKWGANIPLFKIIDSYKIETIVKMIQGGINTPHTSSLGRLFDGIAAITGIREYVRFEGQAAMEFEMKMRHKICKICKEYEFDFFIKDGKYIISLEGVIGQILEDIKVGSDISEVSVKFHRALVDLFLDLCRDIRTSYNIDVVALSGGCFQNRFLIENLSSALEEDNFNVLTHSMIPTNDGGISLGQAVVAGCRINGP